MENKKIKMGIIGCGGIFVAMHLPAFLNNDRVEIIALCDPNLKNTEMVAEILGLSKTICYTDWEEAINVEGLEAIDVCTPNYLHSIVAVAALNKGIHVFTEKPDAVSVEEAEKMKLAAEASRKTLMVMRNNRYNNYSKYLKQYIEAGKMGEIYAARCGFCRRRGIPGKGGWFTTKAMSGGGPLIDLGVHMIDLCMWLMGNPAPVAVSGATYCKFGSDCDGGTFDVEDQAFGFIRFDNGCTMQIEFSWATNIELDKNYIDLRGTKAGASTDTKDGRFKIFEEENGELVERVPELKVSEVSEHEQNLIHFFDVIEGKATPDFVPEQGLNMIKILEAVYQSAELGQEIRL